MKRLVVGIVLGFGSGSAITACAPPASQPSQPTVGGGGQPAEPIGWPYELDHVSTKATYRAAVVELMQLSGAQESMEAMGGLAFEGAIAQNPDLKPFEGVMREFFTKYVSLDAMMGDLVELYRKRFDELQIRQMSAFYRTPTGRLSVKALPELIQEAGRVGQRLVEEHRGELMEMIKQEMARQQLP